MSSQNAKIRKLAARYEQDRQYDKALALYAQLLGEAGGAEDDQDVALYNRVGDLALRRGDVPLAVRNYERAVAIYSAGGLDGNAIAVCNKILRHAPDHAPTHYTLGILSARKGFRANAARHLTDYADRMLAHGRTDEATKALREFADLAPAGEDPFAPVDSEIGHPSRPQASAARLREVVDKLREARAGRVPVIGAGDDGPPARRGSPDLVFLDVYDADETPAPPSVQGFEATTWEPPASAEAALAESDDALEGGGDLPLLAVDDDEAAPIGGSPAALADVSYADARSAPVSALVGELPPLGLADAVAARAARDRSAPAREAVRADAPSAAALLDVSTIDTPLLDTPLLDTPHLDTPLLDAELRESDALGGHAAGVPRVDDEYVDLASWLAEDEGPKTTRLTAGESFETGDEQGDFDRMLSTFRDGVARTLDVDDFQAHHDMGLAYRGMGLIDDAISEFQKAVRAPNRPLRTVEALGECFIERGEPRMALAVLGRALTDAPDDLAADPELLGVLYFLGRAHEALDGRDEALGFYQRVLATDIQFRDAAERLSQLSRPPR